MSVLQDLYVRCQVALEDEEVPLFQETAVLPDDVLRRGVVVVADGGHYVPADSSWTSEDVTFSFENDFTFTAFEEEECECADSGDGSDDASVERDEDYSTDD